MKRLFATLVALTALLFFGSLVTGPAGFTPIESIKALLSSDQSPITMVMQEIRLPRAILGLAIGAGLGIAGAAMQGYLRNPLADPGLIGVSASAALGAVLAIQTGFAAAWALGLPISALSGAAAGVLIVMLLSGPQGSTLTLILAGIAVSALAGALTTLVLNLSPNPFAANEIVFWTMGSLADRSMTHVWLAVPFIAVGAIIIGSTARGLDALTLGEDAAAAMGVRPARIRLALILGTAAIVGAGTAVAGSIGFIGLVVPHILRRFVQARPSALLWASGLGGAAMLLAADIAVRIILPSKDLKLGVLTALVGSPLFLHLIYRTKRQGL